MMWQMRRLNKSVVTKIQYEGPVKTTQDEYVQKIFLFNFSLIYYLVITSVGLRAQITY